MKKHLIRFIFPLLIALCTVQPVWAKGGKTAVKDKPTTFVVQMTAAEDIQQRRALLQIQKVLETFGPGKVRFEVVAYEGGILSLLANNAGTATLVADLYRQGVKFKACRISMRASDLTEADFPLEVEFVPAGAVEMIRMQIEEGARYWRP